MRLPLKFCHGRPAAAVPFTWSTSFGGGGTRFSSSTPFPSGGARPCEGVGAYDAIVTFLVCWFKDSTLRGCAITEA